MFGQLSVELQACLPCESDINSTTRERNKESFKTKFNQFFKQGRIFASDVQLSQCMHEFASSWSFAAVKQGKSFMCHYSKRPVFHKTARSYIAPVPRISDKKADPTLKEIIKCPFVLRYSYVNKPRHTNGCLSLYNVKVTSSVCDHSCTLAPNNQRKALATGGKLGKIDLDTMQSIIERLKDRPHLPPIELRPMLEKCLPFHAGMTAMFIANFRRRVMNYLIKTSLQEDLTHDIASSLVANKVDASQEFITDLDDPIVRTNFSTLLRKVMASNDTAWKAISMLNETKKRIPGFDFKVWKDVDGYPIGILWMTPTMKSNLVRFSHILYLDMQLRQYNSIGWPYCGVSMRNHENETVVGAETIIVEESNSSYQWIVQTCAELEQRFQLSSIKIIFADQKITTLLLKNLGIANTCSLHGDRWHLLNDVWPKLFKPAHKYFDRIKSHLVTMLDSKTEEGNGQRRFKLLKH